MHKKRENPYDIFCVVIWQWVDEPLFPQWKRSCWYLQVHTDTTFWLSASIRVLAQGRSILMLCKGKSVSTQTPFFDSLAVSTTIASVLSIIYYKHPSMSDKEKNMLKILLQLKTGPSMLLSAYNLNFLLCCIDLAVSNWKQCTGTIMKQRL